MRSKADFAGVAAVRAHYDLLSGFYAWLWGEHIHHGYWTDGDTREESPAAAQERLTSELAGRSRIPRGSRVLDVGCGLGGSSRWLARELGCEVLGITLSPVQKRMAERRTRRAGLEGRVRFEVRDAHRLGLPDESFDAVWVVECSEHLADRGRFVAACARLLRPGGVLALCSWLAAERDAPGANPVLLREICRGMVSPELSAMSDFVGWMRAAGFTDIAGEDISRHVAKTWDVCGAIVRRRWVRMLLPFMGRATREFTATFEGMRRAYAEGALAYGLFSARKPAAPAASPRPQASSTSIESPRTEIG